eukprot:1330827-Amphidinium_carterae.1
MKCSRCRMASMSSHIQTASMHRGSDCCPASSQISPTPSGFSIELACITHARAHVATRGRMQATLAIAS